MGANEIRLSIIAWGSSHRHIDDDFFLILIHLMNRIPTEILLEISLFLGAADRLCLSSVDKHSLNTLRVNAVKDKSRLVSIMFNITSNQSSICDLSGWSNQMNSELALAELPKSILFHPLHWFIETVFHTAVKLSHFSTRQIPIQSKNGFSEDQISCFIAHSFHFMLPSDDHSNTAYHLGFSERITRSLAHVSMCVSDVEDLLYKKYHHLDNGSGKIRPVIQFTHDFEVYEGKSRISIHFNTLLLKKLMGITILHDVSRIACVNDGYTRACFNCCTPIHVPSAFFHGYSGIEYHVLLNDSEKLYYLSQRCSQVVITNITAEKGAPYFNTCKRPMSQLHLKVKKFHKQDYTLKSLLLTYLCSSRSNKHYCCGTEFGTINTNSIMDEIETFHGGRGFMSRTLNIM